MKLALKLTPKTLGIAVGAVAGIVFYLLYVYAFSASSLAFYPFAFLILIGSPTIAGILSFLRTKETDRRRTAIISGAAVLVITIAILLLSYVILPLFSYSSTPVPSSCATSNLPTNLNYAIPGVGNGTLLTNDSQSAVVVMLDQNKPTLNSTLLLVNKSDNQVITTMKFGNDILAATISNGVLYQFNNKLGYMINARNGEPVRNVIETDNYRGLYSSNGVTFIQTNVEFSALNVNGSVLSHVKLNFNSIVFGCFFQ
jgi:hypothetical protein